MLFSIGNSGYNEVEKWCKREKIEIPFVPNSLRKNFHRESEAIFSTRNLDHDIYDISHFIKEVLDGKAKDYCVIGCSGHGANSQAMHCYLVKGHLALFFQVMYGGAYVSQEEARRKVNGIFHSVEKYCKRMKNAENKKLVEDEKRLLVVCSDIRSNNGWEWVIGSPGEIEADQWHETTQFLDGLFEIPE